MPDAVLSAIQRAAQSWSQEAQARRRISKIDAVADTLEHCASELLVRLREVAAAERAAKSWTTEAQERRRISKLDSVADTLEHCASELLVRIREVAAAEQTLTPEEHAKREGVTAQTVRTWIRTDQLQATMGPKGYRIAASAKRVRHVS